MSLDIKSFKQNLFAKAEEAGYSDYELYYQTSENFDVEIFKGEIKKYALENPVGLCYRGIINDKIGYAFTQKFDDPAIDFLISEAKNNAEINESKEKEEIFPGSEKYEEIQLYDKGISEISIDKKIEIAKDLEKEMYALDSRVFNAESVVFTISKKTAIMKKNGTELDYEANFLFILAEVIVKQGEETKTAYDFEALKSSEDIDVKRLAKKVVDDAVSCLGAESIKSGKYKAVIKNKAMADFLELLMDSFSGEKVMKGLSMLKDKIGEKIASDAVTICDDALLEGGIASTPFDSEGVASYNKTIVCEGVLKSYLHNTKTAKAMNAEPTGNGFKPNYESGVDVAATNFYIRPSDESFESLLETMGNGILITKISGLHAGCNTISGDFSLISSGFEIEDGKIKRPVEQITVAGNLFMLLNNIEKPACDLEFNCFDDSIINNFGSPSVLVSAVDVSGL